MECSFNSLSDSYECYQCEDNFFLDNSTNSCEMCSHGCQICEDSSTCVQCIKSFFYNQDDEKCQRC